MKINTALQLVITSVTVGTCLAQQEPVRDEVRTPEQWEGVYWDFLDRFYPSPIPEPFIDSDGDGISNLNEEDLDLDINDPQDSGVDSDLDRLKRAEEIFLGTSDNDDDSDNDNVTDWDEIFIYQTDPLSPNVFPELIEPLEEIEIITQPLAQIQATNLIGNSTFRFSFDDPKTYRRLAGTPVPKRSNFRNNNAFQRALDAYNRNVTNNSEPDFSWQSGTDTADGWSAVEGSSIEFWDGIGVELNGSTSDYGVKQTNSLELGQYKLIWNARGRDDLRANNEFKVTVTYDGDDNPFSTRTVIADSGGTFVEGSLLFSVTSDDPDSEERDVVVAFTPTDPSITLGSILGSVELTKVDDTAVTFITPATDPVSSPLDEGDGQNEFTYDDSEDGVLTINLKATIAGIGTAPQETKDLYVFEIDAITGSTLEWAAANANGKPAFTANSDTITATVTFTTLPTRYDHFGEKNVRIKKGEDVVAEQNFEVFYNGIAKNHGDMDNLEAENWFIYYRQNQVALYPSLGPGVPRTGGVATHYKFALNGRSLANTTLGRGNWGFIQIAREGAYLRTSTLQFTEPTAEQLANFRSDGSTSNNKAIYTVSGLSASKDLYFKGFIGVVNHERFHMFNTINTGNNTDFDSDSLGQVTEQELGLLHNKKFSAAEDAIDAGNLVALPQAGNPCGNCDNEAIAGGKEEQFGIDAADTSQDWANPGTNHKTGMNL